MTMASGVIERGSVASKGYRRAMESGLISWKLGPNLEQISPESEQPRIRAAQNQSSPESEQPRIRAAQNQSSPESEQPRIRAGSEATNLVSLRRPMLIMFGMYQRNIIITLLVGDRHGFTLAAATDTT
jgi:hypothetical protein